MPERMTGSCLCGAVSYEVDGPPAFTALCHCRHCQRQTGSAFSMVTGFAAKGYRQTGTTRIFADKSDNGRDLERHFCAGCGSPVLSRIEPLPDMVLIKSGTLDEFANLSPVVEVFCASRMAFLPAIEGTETHDRSNV